MISAPTIFRALAEKKEIANFFGKIFAVIFGGIYFFFVFREYFFPKNPIETVPFSAGIEVFSGQKVLFFALFFALFWAFFHQKIFAPRDFLGKKAAIIFLFFLTGVAFFWRFFSLGKLGLSGDEGMTFLVVRNFLDSGKIILDSGAVLWRDLPHTLASIFSAKLFGLSEFSIRLPSVIFAAATVPVAFFFARDLFRRNDAAILVAAILAVHPWITEFARVARGYEMAAFFIFLTAFLLFRGISSEKYFFAAILSGIFAVFVHQTAQIVLLFFAPFFFTKILFRKKITARDFAFPVLILAAIFFQKWFLVHFGIFHHTDQGIAATAKKLSGSPSFLDKLLAVIPFQRTPHLKNVLFLQKPELFFSTLAILSFAVVAAAGHFLKNRAAFFLGGILTVIFGAFLFSEYKITGNQGVFFALPFLVCFGVFGVFLVFSAMPKKIAAGIFSIVFFAVFFSFFRENQKIITANYGDLARPYHTYWEGFYVRQDNKTPFEFLKKNLQKGDKIIIFGMPQFADAYLGFSPDARVWSGDTLTIKQKNYATGSTELRTVADLKNFLKKPARYFFVTTFSTASGEKNHPRITHLFPPIKHFLDLFADKIVFEGRDGFSKVYLLDFRKINKSFE